MARPRSIAWLPDEPDELELLNILIACMAAAAPRLSEPAFSLWLLLVSDDLFSTNFLNMETAKPSSTSFFWSATVCLFWPRRLSTLWNMSVSAWLPAAWAAASAVFFLSLSESRRSNMLLLRSMPLRPPMGRGGEC